MKTIICKNGTIKNLINPFKFGAILCNKKAEAKPKKIANIYDKVIPASNIIYII